MWLANILAFKRFPGKEIFDVILTLPLVLPPSIIGYYLIVVMGRRGILGGWLDQYFSWSLMFTWYAAVLAAAVVAFPLMLKSARAAFESIDRQYIYAAQLMGKSSWQIFCTITLPLAKRGLLGGAILTFTRALGEFGATLMVAGNIPGKTNTIPLTIYSFAESGEWGKAHVIVLIYTLSASVLLYFANRLK